MDFFWRFCIEKPPTKKHPQRVLVVYGVSTLDTPGSLGKPQTPGSCHPKSGTSLVKDHLKPRSKHIKTIKNPLKKKTKNDLRFLTHFITMSVKHQPISPNPPPSRCTSLGINYTRCRRVSLNHSFRSGRPFFWCLVTSPLKLYKDI